MKMWNYIYLKEGQLFCIWMSVASEGNGTPFYWALQWWRKQ